MTLDPGWKNSDPGTGINIPDPQHCFFVPQYRSFLDADPGWKKFGSGMEKFADPQHC
jgi:hypothetical protein